MTESTLATRCEWLDQPVLGLENTVDVMGDPVDCILVHLVVAYRDAEDLPNDLSHLSLGCTSWHPRENLLRLAGVLVGGASGFSPKI